MSPGETCWAMVVLHYGSQGSCRRGRRLTRHANGPARLKLANSPAAAAAGYILMAACCSLVRGARTEPSISVPVASMMIKVASGLWGETCHTPALTL